MAGPNPLPYPGPRMVGPEIPAPSPVAPVPSAIPDLGLSAFGATDFVETRAGLIADLAPDGEPDASATLDLAALHVAQGLHSDALSFLGSVAVTDRSDRLRRDALRRIAHVLGDIGEAPSAELPSDWPLGPLLDLLEAPEADNSSEMLAGAVAALDILPPVLRAQALPRLLAYTVEREDWREAHDLATRFENHPGIADGSAFHYLLGQVGEAGGEHVAAFDAYRRAALGRDAFAQRARLALVDLGLRTETLRPEEAAELLTQAATLWRGDEIGRATLEALAEARLAAGDRAGAVMALAEVFRAHPRSFAAQKARRRAVSLLEEIYDAGTAGEISLGAFAELHQNLAADLRFEAAFHAEAERFAGHLLALGMTAAAAREFGTLADFVEVAAEVDPAEDEPARRARLRLREAEALIAGGRIDAAAAILAAGPGDLEPALRPRFDALRSEVLLASGDADALLQTSPAPDLLRLKADALYDDGQWGRASDFYAELWEAEGAIGPSLAPRMVLAAHRAGLPRQVERILAALPTLEETPAWAEIAREVANPAEPSSPLRREAVRRQIDSAAQVADRSGRMRAEGVDEPEL
ncbi:hypothetical protein OCH239_00285 [Roseivivax halodurans JCM 10272]|uniref:Tetratricopeptide repeat protein n=2 Tax=Roseivivax halodurans TaxID=93683 RepID=X7EL90_9RHOB|nr:hypothetical protein OCH239_00285 [Roseivivax halodurans JCM 10272]